jgi:hypothetical protein
MKQKVISSKPPLLPFFVFYTLGLGGAIISIIQNTPEGLFCLGASLFALLIHGRWYHENRVPFKEWAWKRISLVGTISLFLICILLVIFFDEWTRRIAIGCGFLVLFFWIKNFVHNFSRFHSRRSLR